MMPNHVLTEITFSHVSKQQKAGILSLVTGRESEVDFSVLLPIPPNVWLGGVSTKHKVFPDNALDWCSANWSTKWNAYGIDQGGRYKTISQSEDCLVLTFQTAWSTPYGWMLALWHKTGLPFEYSYMDEGAVRAKSGAFTAYTDDLHSQPWTEAEADDDEHRRMHKLMWGVEEFSEEEDA